MLILTREDIQRIYTMKECLRDVEKVFRDHTEGHVVTPVRTAIDHPKYGATSLYMPSYLESDDYVAVKIISIFPENHAHGIKSLQSVILLTEAKTGQHVAMMDASLLTVMRTGASTGVATKYLAKEDASSCAVLGCGAQSLGQIQAVMAVRQLTQIALYNRTRAKADELKETLLAHYPEWHGEITVVEDANEAVEKADIVICSTKATAPLFDGARLRPGTHVNAIGAFLPHMQEVDLTTVLQSSKVVVDTEEGALHEAGDLLIPVSKGEWSFDELYAELGEIVTGKKAGREHADEITLYKSVGIAYLDTAVAKAVYERALVAGVGTSISL
ncbi:ornithine cyclodeaminase family protein [Brevibacillus choshinensis]|uniref:ornithine cyclodeaminase family protein n=1 Tax=Brevibacillus choshinensis TaxID=54911 RepID=UPI002E211D0C|nr:ornithine cyclodeaminase family protein [Brevibacillus choshinensis]MED4755389.1 ornithine cyclodeaminase family protein [Brevibacillus choshinensis]MED4783944.1 ornithine cyclodeaminase family protein [Brevibacillus choshinensis]